ncbi:MAG: PorV/PorQ family protein [Elusimicrobia bacterium]|jgi:hypothetical protein|nr:PorV/PorQ family protein [Elusimicrobiota bacterium]
MMGVILKHGKETILVVVLTLCGGVAFGGAFSREARGTSAAPFLKLPVNARAAGLGGAVTALEGEAASLAWNPAGLASLTGRQATLGHSAYLDETAYSNGIYAQPFLGGGIGVGLRYFDGGTLTQTDSYDGTPIGNFHPIDWAVSLGYGREFREWSFGGAGKMVTSRVVHSDTTFAVDLGVLSPGYWSDRFHWGVAARNLGGKLKLADASHPLPVELSGGVAFRPLLPWLVTCDLKFPRDDSPTLSLGNEGHWVPTTGWLLIGRAGWSGTTGQDLGVLAGTTVGFGAQYSHLTVDYAFSPVDDLGNAHRVSLSYSF